MSTKRIPFINNFIYHIYNRGVAKNNIYIIPNDYQNAIKLIAYYRFNNTPYKYSLLRNLPISKRTKIYNKLISQNQLRVKVLTFILIPNHFHFTLKQVADNGISKFISDFTNSYTRYFNIKNDRVGPLLQGTFKSKIIKTDEQLIHLSRYHHLNIYADGVVKNIKDIINYPYSSIQNYIGINKYDFIDTHDVLSFFKTSGSYKKFVLSNRNYQRQLGKIKKLLIDK